MQKGVKGVTHGWSIEKINGWIICNINYEMVAKIIFLNKNQGSRLTFQLASPVASDRFDSLAKTNFSLARHLNIYYRIKSSDC